MAKILTLLVYPAAIAVAEGITAYVSRQGGMIIYAFIFAILSKGQLSVLNMIFMSAVAVYFSWVVKETGSLLGVYLIMPAVV